MRHIYDLYAALTPVMSPTEADKCELWQLAAVLGIDPADQPDGTLDARLAAETNPKVVKARFERMQIKPRRTASDPPNLDQPAPPPKPSAEPGDDLTATVMRQMGIRTT